MTFPADLAETARRATETLSFDEGFTFEHLDAIVDVLPEGIFTAELVVAGLTAIGETWELATEDEVTDALFMLAEDGVIRLTDCHEGFVK